MFILRSVELNDLDDLYELSGKVFFINLPHDRKIIKDKILSSMSCFINPSKNLEDNYYIFVLQNFYDQKIIGVSMIHAQHGTDKEPHFFLRVSSEHKYSNSINTGFVHGTLKLGLDTDGPTEIGGLVISPEYRGHPEKLGKQISFVRFLYMADHKDLFKPFVLSELMPPLDAKGHSPLWEAIGRRFLNMEYLDADLLSRSNKEFILSLFPANNIYMTLLPIEARNAIGKVGKDTLPVKKMLESIGFNYTNEVDPFDGGPHFKCELSKIQPIQNMVRTTLGDSKLYKDNLSSEYLIQIPSESHRFYALKAKAYIHENKFIIDPKVIEKFNLEIDIPIVAIPF